MIVYRDIWDDERIVTRAYLDQEIESRVEGLLQDEEFIIETLNSVYDFSQFMQDNSFVERIHTLKQDVIDAARNHVEETIRENYTPTQLLDENSED